MEAADDPSSHPEESARNMPANQHALNHMTLWR